MSDEIQSDGIVPTFSTEVDRLKGELLTSVETELVSVVTNLENTKQLETELIKRKEYLEGILDSLKEKKEPTKVGSFGGTIREKVDAVLENNPDLAGLTLDEITNRVKENGDARDEDVLKKRIYNHLVKYKGTHYILKDKKWNLT